MKYMNRLFAVLLVCLALPAHARTIYVAPVEYASEGTAEKPTTLRNAFDLVEEDTSITEIILADGVYHGLYRIEEPKDHEGELPHLTVRAAEGAKPLLRYSLNIQEAEKVPGKEGLYRIKQLPPWLPQMWERDTRIRYTTLATVESVAAYPASCFVDREEGYLYFRTSDGKPPKAHDLWLALCSKNSRGIMLRRANTTIDGLHFADMIAHNGVGIQVFKDNATVRNCYFTNSESAVSTVPDVNNTVVENCVGHDIARAIYCNGNNATIRGNWFEHARDRFRITVYPQDDSAYQVYHPGTGGVIENNFCKGYHHAIFIKAREAPYIIRHNTVVDSHLGIGFSSGMKKKCVVSHNIVVDSRAFLFIDEFHSDSVVDYNILWQPREVGELDHRLTVIRGANLGKHNIVADPRFIDPANKDYRVLPDSPAVFYAGEDDKPLGGLGVAKWEDAKATLPRLSLAFEADSKPYGAFGDYTFDRDPWIGGGTTHMKALSEDGTAKRLVSSNKIKLRLRAEDAVGAITRVRVTHEGGEPTLYDYDDRFDLPLPTEEGDYPMALQVQNNRGQWSEPAELVVRVDTSAPKLTAAPTVRANEYGFVIQAKSNEACTAKLMYGNSPDALTQTRHAPQHVEREWNANDGGEWIESWTVPTQNHVIGMLKEDLGELKSCFVKIVLTDQAGQASESDVIQVNLVGQPRTVHAGHGKVDLQTAINLALPGDRIVIAPGVYTETINIHRGGSEGAPITLEAEQPGTVTFDGAKRIKSMIRLEGAPHVTIRNLRLLYFKTASIYAYRSPHLTVDNCVSFNGTGWTNGYHVFTFYSPNGTYTNNLLIGAEYGLYLLKSPRATVLHNTISQGMYGAVSYAFSANGSVQKYNSFPFAGNVMFHAYIEHPDDVKNFTSDYNNLGSHIMGFANAYKEAQPKVYEAMVAEAFDPPKYDVYIRTASKSLTTFDKRYQTLSEWQKATGNDMNSIFADPQYVRPFPPMAHWDWGVKPTSPNLKVTDEQGKPIGAIGVSGE